jgi:hypothetical protein
MAHGERAAAKSNHSKELMSWRPHNRHGGARGPCRGLTHKQMTHRTERARARDELMRDAKSG